MPKDVKLSFDDAGLHVTVGKKESIGWKKLRVANEPGMMIVFSDARHGYMLTNRILGAQKEPFFAFAKERIAETNSSVCGLADQTAEGRKKQDGINSLKKRIKKWWQELTIQIAVFTVLRIPVVFNVWVVRFSLTDFNGILQDNAKVQ